MLIALTGYMGSGKSTVGALVADALGCPFIDLDRVVETKEGKTIAEIFSSGGEASFREKEKKALEETVKKYASSTAVLALGGGTVTIPGAIGLLKKSESLCIYLKAAPQVLASRIEGQMDSRPLASEGFAERLSSREPLYLELAEVVIETDKLTEQETADEIIISCL